MNYFTIEELTRSQTARRLRIDNTPPREVCDHLQELIGSLLNPLRDAWTVRCDARGWGDPALRVTSGYRSPELNRAVGGSPTSAHCAGWAADLVPANGRTAELRDFCRAWLAGGLPEPERVAEYPLERTAGCPFDQLISEREDAAGRPGWIHLGLKNREGLQRGQYLCIPAAR